MKEEVKMDGCGITDLDDSWFASKSHGKQENLTSKSHPKEDDMKENRNGENRAMVVSAVEEEEKSYEHLIMQSQKNSGGVSKDDFTMLKVIGTGSYGKVLLVKKKDTGKLYAMKILKKKFIKDNKQV